MRNVLVPPKIGSYPTNDVDNFYFGQALSGYGIMSNRQYLQANNLPAPKQWSDLTQSVYQGHLAIASPAKSGTTHLTVETILQGEGWDKGWAQILQIGSNCAAVTERSFDVPEGVNAGKYGIGVVIDFFGLSGKYSGFPVDFVYPAVTAVVPASIALIRGGRNLEEARKFVAYTLSIKGQELLFEPAISRLPILPYTVAGLKVPGDYPNIYSVARKARVTFNSQVSEVRRQIVSVLFDEMITRHHKELVAAAKAIDLAEHKIAGRTVPRAAELIRQARIAAFTPLIKDPGLAGKRQWATSVSDPHNTDDVRNPISAMKTLWSSQAKARYEQAEALAREATALIR